MPVYEIKIDVENAPSGSEKLAQQTGQVVPDTSPVEVAKGKTKTVDDRFEKTRQDEGLLNTYRKKATAGALVVGSAALQVYEQNATFSGDSNRNIRINEAKKVIGYGATIAGAAVTGGPVGAALAVAYVGFNLAMENRALINTARVDKYKANYYQDRLIVDVTKRSR